MKYHTTKDEAEMMMALWPGIMSAWKDSNPSPPQPIYSTPDGWHGVEGRAHEVMIEDADGRIFWHVRHKADPKNSTMCSVVGRRADGLEEACLTALALLACDASWYPSGPER
jgi:hypothetical protein